MRRSVTVQFDSRSAIVEGPRLWAALQRVQPRHHRHESARRAGAWRVHLEDLPDLLAALELDRVPIEFYDRQGRPIPAGGLLGWAVAG